MSGDFFIISLFQTPSLSFLCGSLCGLCASLCNYPVFGRHILGDTESRREKIESHRAFCDDRQIHENLLFYN